MRDLNKLLNFVKFTNDFRKIERDIPQSSSFCRENDAEHSYQLAMIAWYICIVENSSLNIEKILKYALIHDLPEVYAGDTPLYTSNNNFFESKKKREELSILKIENNFKEFIDIKLYIERYEKLEDEESKFVYALDKIIPLISIFLDKGHAWKTHRIDIDLLIKKNKERVKISAVAEKYFLMMIKKIQEYFELSNTSPTIFEKAVTHEGERCDLYHIDTDNFNEIDDNLKLKAHAVCIYNGKMLVVNHPEWDIWSIPGGTREEGELIEETLKREIMEETNSKILDFRPISYQKIISPDGNKYHYRLQYLCNIEPLGEFQGDTGGNINKITWIEPKKFEEYIENKEFKKMIVRRALEIIKNNENREN